MSVSAKNNLDLSRKWFSDTGATISVWASAHGFSRDLVYSVLAGRVKGMRGEAFQIRKKLLELPLLEEGQTSSSALSKASESQSLPVR